jgi:peptide/nickel transport system substrate-binding protein
MTRREFALAAGVAGFGLSAPAKAVDTKTLRFIPQSDLQVLDPIWTTAYVTRNHGYMVFDTLFAIDSKFQPHPQMVEGFEVSPDKLNYSFVLRAGLKFHDGQLVRGADCAASIKRWMARDALGQTLATVVADMEGSDDKHFSIHLKEPFPLLIDGLAKVSSLAPFIMPERLAKTDPYQQVTEMVGSGPFKFVKEEHQPGNLIVYVKNADYVPRNEPNDWDSGGKVVKVDRVEWHVVPDIATKTAAMQNGEDDWWENPPADVWPVLAANSDIALAPAPIRSMGCLRFNWLYPPFDNVKMRQAVLAVASQADFMTAFVGDQSNWDVCASFFTCGGPMANNAGSEALTGKRDYDKAKQLIKEAGYKGEKIVVLDAVDQPLIHAEALVVVDEMKNLGLNVEYVASDWATVVTRRASKKPPAEGGWNMFETGWTAPDLFDPSTNVMLRANGEQAWFGWPKDDQLENLRREWLKATDLEERQAIAAKIQQRAFEVVPYVPTGQFEVTLVEVEPLRPQMRVGLGIDQLGVDANVVTQPSDAAFQYIANAELTADLLCINGLVPICNCSITRDHEHARDTREIGRQILGDPVRKILLVGVVAQIGEREHDDGQARRTAGLGDWRSGRQARRRQIGDRFGMERIDPHRPRNVLDALLAQILERMGQLVADLVAHRP